MVPAEKRGINVRQPPGRGEAVTEDIIGHNAELVWLTGERPAAMQHSWPIVKLVPHAAGSPAKHREQEYPQSGCGHHLCVQHVQHKREQAHMNKINILGS